MKSLNLLQSLFERIPAVKKGSLGLGRIVKQGALSHSIRDFLSMIETGRGRTAPLSHVTHTTWAC